MAFKIPFDLPPDVAIAQARAQNVVPPVEFLKMTVTKRAQAFTAANLAKLDQIQAIADALAKSQANGETFADFQKWAKAQDFGLPKHRLETIYRNAVQQSYNAGHWREFEEGAKDRPYLMFDALNDSRTRPSHLALDGVIRPVNDAFWKTHSPSLGHRCLLPWQRVTGKVLLGLKAFYSGKVCQVLCASGVGLSVTVNHPVLTSNGWVNAGDLKQGDKLVVYRRQVDKSIEPLDVVTDVHKNNTPPTIEQVFDSLVSGAGEPNTIPKIAFNLNGDAKFFAGNVDVVAAERELHHSIKTGLLELLADSGFIFSAKALIDGICDGSFLTTGAVYERLGPILSQLRKHGLSVFLEHGHISIGFNPIGLQEFCDPACTDEVLDFQFFQALSAQVVGNNLTGNCGTNSINTPRNPFAPTHNKGILFGPDLAELLESFVGGHGTNPQTHTDLLAAHPGLIEFDDVIDNNISDYSGHVYDLQTVNGCILSTNEEAKDFYILSNCRCTLRSLSRDEAMRRGGVTQNTPAEGGPDAGWGANPMEWGRTLRELMREKIAKAPLAIAAIAEAMIEETPDAE